MIQNTEQEVQAALNIGLVGEVYSQDEVARDDFWFCMFEVAPQDLDFVIVLLQDLMDIGFADRDFAGSGETAVADIGNAAASGIRHPA